MKRNLNIYRILLVLLLVLAILPISNIKAEDYSTDTNMFERSVENSSENEQAEWAEEFNQAEDLNDIAALATDTDLFVDFSQEDNSISYEELAQDLSDGITNDFSALNAPENATDLLVNPYFSEDSVGSPFLPLIRDDIEYTDAKGATQTLPAKFDLRWQGRVGPVRNQLDSTACWAFAAIGNIQSNLRPGFKLTLSPKHMRDNSGSRPLSSWGGRYLDVVQYLANDKGPVREKFCPYETETGTTSYSVGYKPKIGYEVDRTQIIHAGKFIPDGGTYIPTSVKNKLKHWIYHTGGIYTSFHTGSGIMTDGLDSRYFNPATAAYCCMDRATTDHAVMIVGWDDNYSRNNFKASARPKRNGAWIVQNSWSTAWGKNGYFYISYEDQSIGDTTARAQMRERHKWNSFTTYAMGYPNVFFGYFDTPKESQTYLVAIPYYNKGSVSKRLTKVGLDVNEGSGDIYYYLVRNVNSTTDLDKAANRTYLGTNRVSFPGYYSIMIDDRYRIKPKEKVYIVAKRIVPYGQQALAGLSTFTHEETYNTSHLWQRNKTYLANNWGTGWSDTMDGNLFKDAYGTPTPGHPTIRVFANDYTIKGWFKNSKGWRYYYNDKYLVGGHKLNNKFYHFDKYGYALTGWHKFGNCTRYFMKSDALHGAMAIGKTKIGNTTYFFNNNGCKTSGWQRLSGKDYYFDPRYNGGMITGKRKVGNTIYIFNNYGYKEYGWKLLNGKKYYFDPRYGGGMITGLRRVGKGRYYFYPEAGKGYAATNTWIKIGTKRYYFNKSGLNTIVK